MRSLNFQKLNLRKEDILSKTQMKSIMGGQGHSGGDSACSGGPCSYYESGTGTVTGTCGENSKQNCVCSSANSSVVMNGPDGCGQ